MNWISTIVRVAGSQIPGVSALVQLQSEIDASALQNRVQSLEDPISALHPDVPELSKLIYETIKKFNTANLEFSDAEYDKYSRGLAVLKSKGHIKLPSALGRQRPLGVDVTGPIYLMYLCAKHEERDKMTALVREMEECKKGEWLNGHEISQELELPLPFIKACFALYEDNGFGKCSREINRTAYLGMA